MSIITRRTALAGSATLMLVGCGGARDTAFPPGATLIILRHADRGGEMLNDLGRTRAAALPDALADQQIDAILSPGIQRNLDTAAPLSKALGLPVTRLPQERAAQGIAANGAGRTVVWVGNKGNLTDIWEAFAIPGDPPLDYGELFIVTQTSGRFEVERRFHGPQA